jgi:hypothetical protein
MYKNVLLAAVSVFALSAAGAAWVGDEANRNDVNDGSVIGQVNDFSNAIDGNNNQNDNHNQNNVAIDIDVKSEGTAAAVSSSAAAGHFTTGDIGGFGTTNTGGNNDIQVTTGFNNVQQNSVSIAAQGSFNVPLPPSGGGDQ